MPAIDYFALEEKIREVFQADSSLNGVEIRVEGEVNFQPGIAPWVGIYLDRRDPSPNQPLAMGFITRYQLRFSIWCWAMSLESVADAIKSRDQLVSKVELIAMKDRTFEGVFDMSWLMGGELPSGRLENESGQAVYLSGGEIILIAELEASLD